MEAVTVCQGAAWLSGLFLQRYNSCTIHNIKGLLTIEAVRLPRKNSHCIFQHLTIEQFLLFENLQLKKHFSKVTGKKNNLFGYLTLLHYSQSAISHVIPWWRSWPAGPWRMRQCSIQHPQPHSRVFQWSVWSGTSYRCQILRDLSAQPWSGLRILLPISAVCLCGAPGSFPPLHPSYPTPYTEQVSVFWSHCVQSVLAYSKILYLDKLFSLCYWLHWVQLRKPGDPVRKCC